MQAALDNPDFLTDPEQWNKYVSAIKQDEQQTLQQLYEPKLKTKAARPQSRADSKVGPFVKELNTRRKAFQDTGKAVQGSALQEVEQEREVAFEVESVRQVKRPRHYAAHTFPGLHLEIDIFVRTGRLPADAQAVYHALKSISRTSLGRKFAVSSTASDSRLYVSVEFDRIVKLNADLGNDNFLVSPLQRSSWGLG